MKKYKGTELISEETEALQVALTERAKATISSYSATADFFIMYLFCVCG